MIIKKYQGKTEADATQQAQKELGSGVVVMNVKNVKKKGLFSFLSPQMVEITVALEAESERFAPARKDTGVPVIHSSMSKVQPSVSAVSSAVMKTDIIEEKTVATDTLEAKLDNLQEMLRQQLQKPEDIKEEDKAPQKDVAEEKDEELVRFMRLLYNIMLKNEIDERYINQIVDDIAKVHKPGMPFDYDLANTYQKMILKFGKTAEITPAEQGPKVVFFLGPTGVGKTTTIAKLASRFRVVEKKQVALLTADTYRIAAAEQLRTYANILEVPFRVIYTIEEIGGALEEFQEFDYIFVDTAGHSHRNQHQRQNMSDFIHYVDGRAEKEVFLVVSATTKYKDLLDMADSYKEMSDYKLIFTKLDETVALGNLFNLKMHTEAPLSYVTYGQNVPDDIEIFNPQKTVKQLLSGNQ